jgi:hypothetical protein
VLSTDFDDGRCPVSVRIGRNDPIDEGPGGCSNYVLFLRPQLLASLPTSLSRLVQGDQTAKVDDQPLLDVDLVLFTVYGHH